MHALGRHQSYQTDQLRQTLPRLAMHTVHDIQLNQQKWYLNDLTTVLDYEAFAANRRADCIALTCLDARDKHACRERVCYETAPNISASNAMVVERINSWLYSRTGLYLNPGDVTFEYDKAGTLNDDAV